MRDFGERPSETFRCPVTTTFALPLTGRQLALVRARDDHAGSLSPRLRHGEPGFCPTGLRFHFLVVDRKTYESWIRDPFVLAAKVDPDWEATELPAIVIPGEIFVPRTITQVQGVLKRVKAAALKEGEDPESPDFVRTIENSESPVLLGAAQVLVDGGRLVFERPEGDQALVAGLWLLLPEATRVRLWPTTFAFAPALEFDVLVVPHVNEEMLEGYTTEQQAGDYPAGSYELALQRAAEAGDQRDLDAVFNRRDSRQTIRLGLIILALLCVLVLASRLFDVMGPKDSSGLTPQMRRALGGTAIVGIGDQWGALGMVAAWHKLDEDKAREQKR
jgi:hypothetical protein